MSVPLGCSRMKIPPRAPIKAISKEHLHTSNGREKLIMLIIKFTKTKRAYPN